MVTEILSHAGFDFLMLDMEHGPLDLNNLPNLINSCLLNDCSPIVRIPKNLDWLALQALDLGAHGIIAPHINSFEDADNLVRACKYYPQGNRGFTPFTKAGGFTNIGSENYSTEANDFGLTMALIESVEGLKNLDQILKIENLDVVYLGSFDLSQALGFPGQTRHPEVEKEIKLAIDKINAAGKFAGAYVAQSQEDIEWQLSQGLKFIIYQVDTAILHNHVSTITNWFKNK